MDKSLEGKRIRLIFMDDEHNPVPPGTLGTITYVDGMKTTHVLWDSGSTLALVFGVDVFEYLGDIEGQCPNCGTSGHLKYDNPMFDQFGILANEFECVKCKYHGTELFSAKFIGNI